MALDILKPKSNLLYVNFVHVMQEVGVTGLFLSVCEMLNVKCCKETVEMP